ncbi:MAG: molybdopterin-dependent oxidoreductase [Chloroflexi bacterium]|nr:molybdopterin-dependent oxidoreductase [Chloroflexota bacterium]
MPKKERIPPHQSLVEELQVLHWGSVPPFDASTWDFRVEGLVDNPLRLSWEEFRQLPRTISVSDFHCVTGWSRLDNRWEGVLFKIIAQMARPQAQARYMTIVAEGDYTTSMPLEDLMTDDVNVVLAYRLDGKDLEPVHGGPLRLVVPHKYAYKSAKWVRALRFTQEQELGFWEKRGYSDSADPWKEERYA